MFHGLPDSPVSENHTALRIRPTQSRSLLRQEDAVCVQIANIAVPVEDSVVRLFGDAGRGT